MATWPNRLIWGLLVTAPITYMYAAQALQPIDAPHDVTRLEFPLAVVATVAIIFGTWIWRKRKLVDPIQSGSIDLADVEDLGRAFTPFILNLVLSQAVAIFGVALGLLSNDTTYIYAFSLVGLVLMYLYRPTAPTLNRPEADTLPD